MRLDPITLSNSIPITTQPPSSHFAFGAYTATSGQVMLGGHSALDPLLPIPNRTVKRSCADDSAHTVCESRSPPGSPTKTPLRSQPRGVFFIRNRLVYDESRINLSQWPASSGERYEPSDRGASYRANLRGPFPTDHPLRLGYVRTHASAERVVFHDFRVDRCCDLGKYHACKSLAADFSDFRRFHADRAVFTRWVFCLGRSVESRGARGCASGGGGCGLRRTCRRRK